MPSLAIKKAPRRYHRKGAITTVHLKQRSHVNVVAKVRKPAGDDLSSSVVSILSHFCNLRMGAGMLQMQCVCSLLGILKFGMAALHVIILNEKMSFGFRCAPRTVTKSAQRQEARPQQCDLSWKGIIRKRSCACQWPSRVRKPGLLCCRPLTRMRGRRPSSSAKCSTRSNTPLYSVSCESNQAKRKEEVGTTAATT